jgi:mycothiol synthase
VNDALPELDVREANLSDAPSLAEIMEHSDKFFNPEALPVGVIEAEEILSGYIDSIVARKIIHASNQSVLSFVTVHPDLSRKRIYADSWHRQLADSAKQMALEKFSIRLTVDLAKSLHPDFDLWVGANALDQSYISQLRTHGFEVLRTYWGLRAPIDSHQYPHLENHLEMRVVKNEEDMKMWWQVHQDSFSKHFGFMPRAFDEWKSMMHKAVGIDINARWILLEHDEPVGFIECSDIKKDTNSGFIDGIGVIHKAQGKGYGELMLRWAFAYYTSIERQFVELNADAGNESGALRLYEKVGMKPKHTWQHYKNSDWTRI